MHPETPHPLREIGPEHKELLYSLNLQLTAFRQYMSWGNVSMPLAYAELVHIARTKDHPKHFIAKECVHASEWSPMDNTIALKDGWYVGWKDTYISRFVARGYTTAIFESQAEAQEFVKQEAARGDVLAEKALVEITRRIFRGVSQNVSGSQGPYYEQN